jgi:hypothetical protein
MNLEPFGQMLDRPLLVGVSRYQFQNLTLAEAVLVLTGDGLGFPLVAVLSRRPASTGEVAPPYPKGSSNGAQAQPRTNGR